MRVPTIFSFISFLATVLCHFTEPDCSTDVGIDEIVLLPNPEMCSTYWTCEAHSAVLNKCPSDKLFDAFKLSCEDSETASCAVKIPTTEIPSSTITTVKPSPSTITTMKPTSTPTVPKPISTTTQKADTIKPSIEEYPFKCPPSQWPIKKYLFPNPKDCHSFYKCIYGKPHLYICPDNLHFNPVLSVCDWPNKVKSVFEIIFFGVISMAFAAVPRCPIHGYDNEAIPDSEDCGKFYYCKDNVPYSAFCPPNQYFDVITLTCLDAAEAVCAEKTIRILNNPTSSVHCPMQKDPADNVLLPNPLDCNSFYQCVWGTPILQKCPKQLHFNEKLKICDWPKSANSIFITVFIGLIASTYTHFVPECSQEGTGNERIADPENCRKFYICRDYVPEMVVCPRPLYFDVKTFECVDPKLAICGELSEEPVCPAQQSLDENILIPNPKDCNTFYQCAYGYPHLQHCPEGLHFNPEKSWCDWPINAHCVIEP
ncbi:uncharacterized protein LOC131665687 [Phymastichus coffea]|uniref:uncharacterized protein LOC131665687 n=1 Tax=Phymastichus coffea TaxID=108790 RepID=UPI00273ABA0C|nr:uncharacterized protein LOC131665687 [Phymastichus coffea]